jgi:large conductance mechanosensitive channel
MINEFRKFIMRGSVLDMAVGIIIGSAFGAVVTSLVNDVVMPPIGLLLGKVDFTSMFLNLSGTPYASLAAAKDAGAPTINYGLFINTVVTFLLVAFVVFLLVRAVNRLTQKPVGAPTTRECPYCYSEIPVRATRCPSCTSELKA